MTWFRATLVRAGICLVTLSGAAYLALAQQPSPPQPPARSATLDESSLHWSKLAEVYCAACHGLDGNSTDPQYPKIAGQNAYYIRWQLSAFKRGGRRSDIMSGVASTITDAQIRELAEYFSDQPVKPDVVNARSSPRSARAFSNTVHKARRLAWPVTAEAAE